MRVTIETEGSCVEKFEDEPDPCDPELLGRLIAAALHGSGYPRLCATVAAIVTEMEEYRTYNVRDVSYQESANDMLQAARKLLGFWRGVDHRIDLSEAKERACIPLRSQE